MCPLYMNIIYHGKKTNEIHSNTSNALALLSCLRSQNAASNVKHVYIHVIPLLFYLLFFRVICVHCTLNFVLWQSVVC